MHNFFAIEVEAEYRRCEQERRIAAIQIENQKTSCGPRYLNRLLKWARANLYMIASSVLTAPLASKRETCSGSSQL